MISRATILGGRGQVGQLLTRSLRESRISVVCVDTYESVDVAETGVDFVKADVSRFDSELISCIASSDCVCICLPEVLTLQVAPRILATMTPGSLWVDTLSVKSEVTSIVSSELGSLEALSINPMFAPSMGWSANPVAVVEVAAGPKGAFLKSLLADWGARVEMVSTEEHDRFTALIQVATHAAVLSFGGALLNEGFDLGKALSLATPPHRLLLILLYRIVKQNPQVYWDIQAYHPLAGRVRTDLSDFLAHVQTDGAQDNSDWFSAQFAQMRELLAPQREQFEKWSSTVFSLPRD